MKNWKGITNFATAIVIAIVAALGFIFFTQYFSTKAADNVSTKSHGDHTGHAHEDDHDHSHVELSLETIKANNIEIETAGPIDLEMQLDVMGKITPNEELTVFISPRFPGVVKEVNKKLGDYVRKGEVLAVIESNESLKNYEVRSEIEGTVIKRDINLGMYLSGQEAIYVVSDLSSVWADFNIYRRDASQVKINDPIQITNLDGNLKQQSTVAYISPIGNESTQSVIARAIVSNPKGKWTPGLFVSGVIITDSIEIPIAVKQDALQTLENKDVIFTVTQEEASQKSIFEPAFVQLGRYNKEWIEVKSGVSEGEHYVSRNSFILKADLEKSNIEHEH